MKEEKKVLDSSMYVDQINQTANRIVSLVEEKATTTEEIQQQKLSLIELQRKLNELQEQINQTKEEIKVGKGKIKSINWNLLKNKYFNIKLSSAYVEQKELNLKKYTK